MASRIAARSRAVRTYGGSLATRANPQGLGVLGDAAGAVSSATSAISGAGAAALSTVADYNPLAIVIAGLKSTVDLVLSKSTQDAIKAGDKVTQTADGSGSIGQVDFKTVGNTCKPINFPALNYTRELQNQMNRIAQVKGWGKINPDGAIGPGTLALLRKIKAAYPQIMGDASACLWIAADADVIGDQVKQVADSLKAPAQVGHPAGQAASIVTTSGLTIPAPGPTGASALDAFGGMSTGQKVVFAALAVGIGYKITHRKKGRK